MVHSKLQLKVLSMYRLFLRTARSKPGATQHVREEFRRNAAIPRLEIVRIEHIIRRAERQLKLLSNPSIKSIGLFHSDLEPSSSAKDTTKDLPQHSPTADALQESTTSATMTHSNTKTQILSNNDVDKVVR